MDCIAGLVITMVSALAGVPVAAQVVADNDEALVAGLTWGSIAGVVLGGITVGALCGRAGVPFNNPFSGSLAAPGTLMSIPLLIVAILGRDWEALRWVVLYAVTSSLAAALAARVIVRNGRYKDSSAVEVPWR